MSQEDYGLRKSLKTKPGVYHFTYNTQDSPVIAQKATVTASNYTEAIITLRKKYNAYNITIV